MKNFAYFIVVALLFVPGALAQETPDHVNVGVFGNYARLSDGSLNLAGLGARVSVGVLPMVQLEAESAYNFDQAFTQGFRNTSTGAVSIGRTDVRLLDGLFGPKLMTNKGPVRLFVTAKGGFMNFNISNSPATFGTVGNAYANLRGATSTASLIQEAEWRLSSVPSAFAWTLAMKSILTTEATTTCGLRLGRRSAFDDGALRGARWCSASSPGSDASKTSSLKNSPRSISFLPARGCWFPSPRVVFMSLTCLV